MAYDRTTNTAAVAAILKRDNNNQEVRELVNYVMDVINKSGAEVQAASLATLITALDTPIA